MMKRSPRRLPALASPVRKQVGGQMRDVHFKNKSDPVRGDHNHASSQSSLLAWIHAERQHIPRKIRIVPQGMFVHVPRLLARRNPDFQALKNCEFFFPDAPHPPSEVVFQAATGAEVSDKGSSRKCSPLLLLIIGLDDTEEEAGSGAARAWYGWHPNREHCSSFTGVDESLRFIAQACAWCL
jgi:hypothetical protein